MCSKKEPQEKRRKIRRSVHGITVLSFLALPVFFWCFLHIPLDYVYDDPENHNLYTDVMTGIFYAILFLIHGGTIASTLLLCEDIYRLCKKKKVTLSSMILDTYPIIVLLVFYL